VPETVTESTNKLYCSQKDDGERYYRRMRKWWVRSPSISYTHAGCNVFQYLYSVLCGPHDESDQGAGEVEAIDKDSTE